MYKNVFKLYHRLDYKDDFFDSTFFLSSILESVAMTTPGTLSLYGVFLSAAATSMSLSFRPSFIRELVLFLKSDYL